MYMELDEFVIDKDNNIRLGDIKGVHTVREFYTALVDWINLPHNGAGKDIVIGHTIEYIELINGYNIDDEFATWLTCGRIKQEGCDYFAHADVENVQKRSYDDL